MPRPEGPADGEAVNGRKERAGLDSAGWPVWDSGRDVSQIHSKTPGVMDGACCPSFVSFADQEAAAIRRRAPFPTWADQGNQAVRSAYDR